MLLFITLFALVVSVSTLAVAVFTMSRCAAGKRATDLRIDVLANQIGNSSQTKLRTEVDDVRGALERVIATNRKELGSLWGRLGGRTNGAHKEAAADVEFQELIALQGSDPLLK